MKNYDRGRYFMGTTLFRYTGPNLEKHNLRTDREEMVSFMVHDKELSNCILTASSC